MRMNINHATKAGVTVHEYKVLEKRAPAIDKEFNRITNEWLEVKKAACCSLPWVPSDWKIQWTNVISMH